MIRSTWTICLSAALFALVALGVVAARLGQAQEETQPEAAAPSGGFEAPEAVVPTITVPLETKYYNELWQDKSLAGREYRLVALDPVDSYISFPYLVQMESYQGGDPNAELRDVKFLIVDESGQAAGNLAGLRQYVADLKSADLKFRLAEPKVESPSAKTVVVQLNSGIHAGKLLAQNVGKRSLTLIARPSEKTVDAVGEKTIPGRFQIRDWIVPATDPAVKRVRLQIQDKDLDQDEIQAEIDELQRKKFRLQLRGLVGSGQPASPAVTLQAAPYQGPRTGGFELAADQPQVATEPRFYSQGTSPARRPSALQQRTSNGGYASMRLKIPLQTDRYPLEEIFEVIPSQSFTVVARKTDENGDTTESLIAANCRFVRAEMDVRPGPDRNRLVVDAPLSTNTAHSQSGQAKIDRLDQEGYEFQLDGLALQPTKPEEVRVQVRLPLQTDKFPLSLLQANVGNEAVKVAERSEQMPIDAIVAQGCRLEEVNDKGEGTAEVVVSFDKNAPRPSPAYLKQADVDREVGEGVAFVLLGLFDPNKAAPPEQTYTMWPSGKRPEEPGLQSYRLAMLPVEPTDYPRNPATDHLTYDVEVLSETGEAIPFATQCLIHVGHEPQELREQRMMIAVPIGFDYPLNRKVSPKLIETLDQLGKKFQLKPHEDESEVAAAPAKGTNSLVAPTAPAGNGEPSDANVLSQPRRIEVRLDPKLVDEELLEANIGNGMIQVLAIRRGADPGTAGPVDVQYQMATGCKLIEVKHVGIPHPNTPKAFVGHPVAVLLVSKPSPQHPDRLPTQKEIDDALEAGARFRLEGLAEPSIASGNASAITVERGTLTSSSAPVMIRVPLDANTFSMEWLNHNKRNQQISLFAEGTGITTDSVGSHRIGGLFEIGKMLQKSPGESILIVELKLVHGLNLDAAANLAETQQKQVDQYQAKKFRFVLQGLIPLGELVRVTGGPQLPVPYGVPYNSASGMAPTQVVSPTPRYSNALAPSTGTSLIPASNYPTYQAVPVQNGGAPLDPSRAGQFVPPPNAPGSRFFIPNAPTSNAAAQRYERFTDSVPATGSGNPTADSVPTQRFATASSGNFSIPIPQAATSQLTPAQDAPGVPPTGAWVPNQNNPSQLWFDSQGGTGRPSSPTTSQAGSSQSKSDRDFYYEQRPRFGATTLPANAAEVNPVDAQKKTQAYAKLRQAKTDAEKTAAREELRKVLADIFTADMQQRERKAKEIEARVKQLRDQYDAREEAKDEIIDLQLQLLEKQAAGLEFPGGASSAQ